MRLLTTLLFLCVTLVCSSQTLFSEDFETLPAFTLNTSDANSVSGVTNGWLVNNIYAGGSGTVDCLGFPLDFSIAATPAQPVGIVPANGQYLHTASLVALSNGIQCCSFGAADGFCTDPDDVFASMSTDASTLGSPDVSVKFWWLCNGGDQTYGEVWYSTDAGGSWVQLTAPIAQYRNQLNWVEQTASLPAFGNQATLRFGFRFHNGTSLAGGSDPGFAIDDVRVIANTTSSINTSLPISVFCEGSSLNVPYAISGNFNAGNVFSVQLSNALGSFASPIAIGTLPNVVAGTIPCMIPLGTPEGIGYRVRVVSSAPVVIGSDNGVDVTIHEAAYAGMDMAVAVCSTGQVLTLSTGGDAGGVWSGPSPIVGGVFDPATMLSGTYVYRVNGLAPCPVDSAAFTITAITPPNAGTSQIAVICKNTGLYDLFDFLGGGPDAGGTWEAPNGTAFSGTFNSESGTPGIYTYTVAGSGPCPSDDAVVTVQLGEPALAGPDGVWNVCSNELPVDLHSLLVDAHLTGIWFDGSGSPFNGIIFEGGAFIYIDYAQAPCTNDTAQISVVVQQAGDAGANATAQLCANEPTVALITLLGGTPQGGGSWTGPDGSPVPSGSINPSTAASGLYTYTVQPTAPCPSDDAVLAVIISPCSAIDETNGRANGLAWLGSADGTVTFAVPELKNAHVDVMDPAGRLVFSQELSSVSGQISVAIHAISSGVYTLRVKQSGLMGIVRFQR
jgi:hypothetical protein